MWILGRSCGEPRVALKIELPPGAYLVPRSYDVGHLAALARFLCDVGPAVRDTVVMTWKHADTLEALGRVRGDGHRSDALWALHGEAGAPLPVGGLDLKLLIAKRFPSLQPRWVVILDPDASASSLGWLEAHVKMPLLSWLGRLLGDERHPLHAVAVDRIDVQALARMTSDPLEMMEIVEKAVEHRLTYAFPAGIPVETVVSSERVNIEELDWSRSLRVAAAHRLARRVNSLSEATRADATRVLLRLELTAERHEPAQAALVRAGLLLPSPSTPDGRLALARAVLDDEDSRIVFQDALELSGEDRRTIDSSTPRRRVGVPDTTENAPTVAIPDVGQEAIAPEDVSQRYEALRQAAGTTRASATAMARFAEQLYRSKADISEAASLYERAVATDPTNVEVLRSYANFMRFERRDLDQAQELYESAITADPTDAITLGNYGDFLCNERRDLDRAQELYERVIATDPKNAGNLNNYANFLRNERRDLNRAQELYELGIAADPKNGVALNNLAVFMQIERRDLDRARELYERAIAANPNYAVALSNFAGVLYMQRDIDRAQELFERAIAANSKYAAALGNFAVFMQVERRDLDRAQELYERAVAADPTNAISLGNFAHLLFLMERRPAAVERLREAITQADAMGAPVQLDLASELAFYRAVHLPEERDEALRALQSLVAQGARSLGWDFRAHALLAEKAGDADAPLFFALADVLSGKADATTLTAFPRWTQASPFQVSREP